MYFGHFHFPVRRTAAYRHKKALHPRTDHQRINSDASTLFRRTDLPNNYRNKTAERVGLSIGLPPFIDTYREGQTQTEKDRHRQTQNKQKDEHTYTHLFNASNFITMFGK